MESDESCTIPVYTLRREFLVDINRTPCPVGLRKEQIDYRARTDPLQLFYTLFFLLFRFLVSPHFFTISRFFCSHAILRGVLFRVDDAKSSK